MGDGRERVVSDTASTAGELRREQVTALLDAGWTERGDTFCSPDGDRSVTVGPAERERGRPALTRTLRNGC